MLVYAVLAKSLPPGYVAFLGISELRHLGVSVDTVMDRPGTRLEYAMVRSQIGPVNPIWETKNPIFFCQLSSTAKPTTASTCTTVLSLV
jgi:hypothetical protein